MAVVKQYWGEKPRKTIKQKDIYKHFLKSKRWKNIKNSVRKNKCEACGATKNLQVHHARYKYALSRKKKLAKKNLRVLCKSCHCAFHKKYKTKENMVKDTEKFIQRTRKEIAEAEKINEELVDDLSFIR